MADNGQVRTFHGGMSFGARFAPTRDEPSQRGVLPQGVLALLLGMGVLVPSQAQAETRFLGPMPYLSAADSPFDLSGLGTTFFLEDFEDGELNTPGISQLPPAPLLGSRSEGIVQLPGELTDSVDADDGVIDGSGNGGHALTSRFEVIQPTNPERHQIPLIFEFDPGELGFFPNAFGAVWTDGFPGATVDIQILDIHGHRRQQIITTSAGDQSRLGTTTDDFFFGVISTSPIERVDIYTRFTGSISHAESFELDHLQYGVAIPEPSALVIAIAVALSRLLGSGLARIQTAALVVLLAGSSSKAETIFLGPLPYLSAADSPFDLSGLGTTFFLEDFEDGELNTPGIMPFSLGRGDPIGIVMPPGPLTDSVDADDGAIDGLGNDGYAFRSVAFADLLIAPPVRVMSMRFQFDANALGTYPTAVGFVWTDGIPIEPNPLSGLVVSVYDPTGQESEMLWTGLGDEDFAGMTEEDRFFGVVQPAGIRRVDIDSVTWGFTDHEFFEIDHLQYGRSAIPEASTITLALLSILAYTTLYFQRRGPHATTTLKRHGLSTVY